MSRETFHVEIHCGLCTNATRVKLDLPEGWEMRYDSVHEERAFCPRHAPIKAFADSQCPGCVGGWGNCLLWESFAFSRLKLTAEDFLKLETGVCPKRVNGTLGVNLTRGTVEFEKIDLSDAPQPAAGKALAEAIREYAAKYHNKERTP